MSAAQQAKAALPPGSREEFGVVYESNIFARNASSAFEDCKIHFPDDVAQRCCPCFEYGDILAVSHLDLLIGICSEKVLPIPLDNISANHVLIFVRRSALTRARGTLS